MNYTAFGVEVKKKLIDLGQSQVWLAEQVGKETGLFVDGGYIYKILTGRRNAPKIKASIENILGIVEAKE